jgi:hypothetical protein
VEAAVKTVTERFRGTHPDLDLEFPLHRVPFVSDPLPLHSPP